MFPFQLVRFEPLHESNTQHKRIYFQFTAKHNNATSFFMTLILSTNRFFRIEKKNETQRNVESNANKSTAGGSMILLILCTEWHKVTKTDATNAKLTKVFRCVQIKVGKR